MNIDTEITEDNFNELLEDLVKQYNKIKEVELIQLEEGEIVEFHQVNYAMVRSTERVRLLGKILSKMKRLERYAQKQYDLRKARKILEARNNRDEFPSEETRKAYAEDQAEPERKRLIGINSICEEIHRERQDLWDYRRKLETISKNLQTEAYLER